MLQDKYKPNHPPASQATERNTEVCQQFYQLSSRKCFIRCFGCGNSYRSCVLPSIASKAWRTATLTWRKVVMKFWL